MLQPNKTYFESLATKCIPISHSTTDKAFFEIEDPEELNEFDDALRSMTKKTCMLLVNEGGEFDDANSDNHTDTQELQLYILKRKLDSNSIGAIRTETKTILLEVLKRIKKDFKSNVKFRYNIANTSYYKVGPMGSDSDWYGHTAIVRFICPFTTAQKEGIWSL